MKAIVKETGEIVEVSRVEITHVYGEPKGAHEIFLPKELELSCIDVDWEQRRYELAKAAMQGKMSTFIGEPNYYTIAKQSVKMADALIEQLKGGRE